MTSTTTNNTVTRAELTPVELIERLVSSARPVSTRTKRLEQQAQRLHDRLRALTSAEHRSPDGQALEAELMRLTGEIAARRILAAVRRKVRRARWLPGHVLAPRLLTGERAMPLFDGEIALESAPQDGVLVLHPLERDMLRATWHAAGESWRSYARMPGVMPDRLRDRARRAEEAATAAAREVSSYPGEYRALTAAIYPAHWDEPRPLDPIVGVALVRGLMFLGFIVIGAFEPITAREAAALEHAA